MQVGTPCAVIRLSSPCHGHTRHGSTQFCLLDTRTQGQQSEGPDPEAPDPEISDPGVAELEAKLEELRKIGDRIKDEAVREGRVLRFGVDGGEVSYSPWTCCLGCRIWPTCITILILTLFSFTRVRGYWWWDKLNTLL